MNTWVDDVLGFWFKELGPQDWFSSGEELDAKTKTRFLTLFETLSINPPPEVYTDPRTAVAAVLVLDQFPRNMFRGTARAFATDDLAMRIARQAVSAKFDEKLTPEERLFLYMPYQHSEVSADQGHSIMLFGALGMEEPLRYAVDHQDIIARFGRFPHRNAALGRKSTDAELAFMQEHAGFGQ